MISDSPPGTSNVWSVLALSKGLRGTRSFCWNATAMEPTVIPEARSDAGREITLSLFREYASALGSGRPLLSALPEELERMGEVYRDSGGCAPDRRLSFMVRSYW